MIHEKSCSWKELGTKDKKWRSVRTKDFEVFPKPALCCIDVDAIETVESYGGKMEPRDWRAGGG